MTNAFFEDGFDRADNTDIANGWSFNDSSGDLQIINQTARQNTASVATETLYRTVASAASEIGAEYAVQAIVASSGSGVRAGRILLRYNITDDDGYAVKIGWDDSSTDALTLTIFKVIAGSDTSLATLDVTSFMNTGTSSYDNVFQSLTARIYDEDESVKIEVKLNDESDPVLSANDKGYPQFRDKGSFGFRFEDNAAAVAGHIFLGQIAIEAIQEVQGDYSIRPKYWTFSRIYKQAVTEATRDSHSNIDTTTFKVWVNASIQEMYEHCNRPRWSDDIITFKSKLGIEDYELPDDVVYYDSVIHDTLNQNTIDVVAADPFRQGTTTTSSGTPYEAYEVGTGVHGGPILRLYPKPNAAKTYTIRVSKSPRYLEDDDQIPDVPQNLCQWLSWGAVMRYSLRDSDRTHLRASRDMWVRGLDMARRQSKRLGSSKRSRITVDLSRHNFNDYEQSRYGIRRRW